MDDTISKVLADESGATAVEYGLILAMVFLAMVSAVQGVGNETIALWNTISTSSEAAINQSNV
ncbi:Flp family type IVb pilin [Parerythrobacter aestuarii]|uniref:Flp family type IVb pilin n=1 Tax=Parerythrobacter aestuarii TaxID=3020909 RepID=UPI0024DE1E11|nr:Flp family type IVb pilin [Parerythrobacter aestuarii]